MPLKQTTEMQTTFNKKVCSNFLGLHAPGTTTTTLNSPCTFYFLPWQYHTQYPIANIIANINNNNNNNNNNKTEQQQY